MQLRSIAVDFDDVLMDFNSGFIPYHNRMYGSNISYEGVYSYDMSVVYGCDFEVIVERVKTFYRSPEHNEVKPILGAVGAIHRLRQNYMLDVVTSRARLLRSIRVHG